MSAKEQARALMMRHHHLIKQRQQSMLTRAAVQIGIPVESVGEGSHIQGKSSFNAQIAYDRSPSALS
jgi:hypothetical protein